MNCVHGVDTGNIAAGSSDNFLPAIFKLIQGDQKKRYTPLQALKEVSDR